MYQYRSLNGVSLQQLSDCFNLAFSGYEQSIHFTVESLNYYLTASAVDLSLSFGAFCNGQMVGFILNAKGIYENKNVVFDAGTGIVPDHRGKKVFSSLFQYTCQQLQLQGITKYYLEVLQSNHNAVDIYSKKGFQIRRSYSVLTASGPKYTRNENVTAILYSDFKGFTTTTSVAPSFEHTSHAIDDNPQLYEVLFLSDLAYCIYAKRNGEIIQLHYNDLAALKDVLAALTHQYPSAMAKNIDCNCSDIIEMLKVIGFKEILKQYEMVKDI